MAGVPPDATAEYMAGWDGTPVAEWRLRNRDIWWHALVTVYGRALFTKEHTTYADWVGAYVDLRSIRQNPESFTRLWLEEIDVRAVPRAWLRWAISSAQVTQKVTPGNPIDSQHTAYLVDCDLFLTSDVRFHHALKVVATHAPIPVGEPCLVAHDSQRSVIDRIIAGL
jgi:hypothetical protein